MMITGTTAALKMAVRPATEYQAAMTDISTEISSMRYPNIIECIYLEVYCPSILGNSEKCKRFG
jgi:hypothetical protein